VTDSCPAIRGSYRFTHYVFRYYFNSAPRRLIESHSRDLAKEVEERPRKLTKSFLARIVQHGEEFTRLFAAIAAVQALAAPTMVDPALSSRCD
jgi:hypothetical protein